MRFNIIGDIHGRECWKDLVKEDCTNIFLGDYFDPYDDISIDELEKNFLEIIAWSKEHDAVLLLGNHDLHYLHYESTVSRYDFRNASRIEKLLLDNIDAFYGITYNIGPMCLVSHAGVTKQWLERTGFTGESKAQFISKHVNDVFWGKYDKEQHKWPDPEVDLMFFTFKHNCYRGDYYGTSPVQSPVWIRPQTLLHDRYNGMEGGWQIVGHTQVKKLLVPEDYKIILVDVCGTYPASLVVDYEEGETYNYSVNEKSGSEI
jgi:hypothetical protein